MNSLLSPQRDTNSPVDCLRGCGRIRARLPHRALWTVPRQNSPRKNSQRANQQSHSRIFLKIFPRPSTKICQEHFQPLAAKSLFHHNKFSSGFYLGIPHSIVSKQTVYPSSSTKSLSMIFLMIFFAFSNALYHSVPDQGRTSGSGSRGSSTKLQFLYWSA